MTSGVAYTERYGLRHFGFINPDPQEVDPVYGYEMWVVVPEDFVVSEPFHRMEFAGGFFASVPTHMTVIPCFLSQLQAPYCS